MTPHYMQSSIAKYCQRPLEIMTSVVRAEARNSLHRFLFVKNYGEQEIKQ
jgi:hypothetical protein